MQKLKKRKWSNSLTKYIGELGYTDTYNFLVLKKKGLVENFQICQMCQADHMKVNGL